MPTLRGALGNGLPTLENPYRGSDRAQAFPADALLGVPGTPQSGTGQTALLTGRNGPALFGRHFGPWVPVALRPLVTDESLLARAQASGLSCAFANAYPSQFRRRAWSKRPAGPPLAAHGARLLTRDEKDLAAGGAVASEITNKLWISRLGLTTVPDIPPEEAGTILAEISARAQLTLFAHYGTDTAGHKKNMTAAVQALEKVDRFLSGLLQALPADTLLVLSSDHGNLEEVTKGHTANPVLTLALGPGAAEMAAKVFRISDVPDAILELLGCPSTKD